MERIPVESEAIRSLGYRSLTLEVEFTEGGVYQYFSVPKKIFLEFIRAESKGRYFQEQIRDRFQYRKVH